MKRVLPPRVICVCIDLSLADTLMISMMQEMNVTEKYASMK